VKNAEREESIKDPEGECPNDVPGRRRGKPGKQKKKERKKKKQKKRRKKSTKENDRTSRKDA